MVKQNGLPLLKLVEMMSTRPAQILGLPGGTLKEGAAADVTLIDPNMVWKVDKTKLYSKSCNTPFDGMELTGRAVCTILGGKISFAL